MILFINVPSSLLKMPFTWNHNFCVEMAAKLNEGYNVSCVDNACLRLNPEVLQAEISSKNPDEVILYGGFPEYIFVKQYLGKLKHTNISVMGFPTKYGERLSLPIRQGVLPSKNVNSLPTPLWDILPLQNYFMYSPIAESPDTIQLTRRATYNCSYDGKFQNVKKTLEALRYLKIKFGYDFMVFNDDFSSNKKWTYIFADQLEQYDLLKTFKYSCKADYLKVDPQLLNRLRETGCSIINYGDIDVSLDNRELPRLEGAIETAKQVGLTPVLHAVIRKATKEQLVIFTKFLKSQNLVHKPKIAEPYPDTSYWNTTWNNSVETIILQVNQSFMNMTEYSDIELLGIAELVGKGDLARLERIRSV